MSRARLATALTIGLMAATLWSHHPTTSSPGPFHPTGGEQTYQIPAGVTKLRVVAIGGRGGNGADDGDDFSPSRQTRIPSHRGPHRRALRHAARGRGRPERRRRQRRERRRAGLRWRLPSISLSPKRTALTYAEDDGTPAPGRSVQLNLGAQSCVDNTDAQAPRECTIASVGQPLNVTATIAVSATFPGDQFYEPSQA